MKKTITLLGLVLCSAATLAQPVTTKSSTEQQVGYSFGYLMGRSNVDTLKGMDLDAFVAGLKAASLGQQDRPSDEDMARILTQFKKQAEAKQLIELKQRAEANDKIGKAFLAENSRKDGVKVTSSGLQYLVLQVGSGKKPKASSKVRVHYEGRLIDGTVFDSSMARQQPAEFQVTQVIQGWTEGLQLMREGAKYRFFIPANLGYGQIGSGDAIEPNSTLIFDVELLEVINK